MIPHSHRFLRHPYQEHCLCPSPTSSRIVTLEMVPEIFYLFSHFSYWVKCWNLSSSSHWGFEKCDCGAGTSGRIVWGSRIVTKSIDLGDDLMLKTLEIVVGSASGKGRLPDSAASHCLKSQKLTCHIWPSLFSSWAKRGKAVFVQLCLSYFLLHQNTRS